MARQREEFERQKLEHERDVELFRAEQAAATAAHEKRLAELEEASERSAGGQHAVDDETLPKQRLRVIQSPASVVGAENNDNDCQNRESGVERPRIRTHQRHHSLPGQRAIDSTSAVISELSGRRCDVQASDRSSPQKRLASRMTDVTTWLKETPLPRAGRKPQHTGEVHVQGARAAHGAPVRHVARRLATDDADCESGSQQRAAHSLIDSFAGAVNLGLSLLVSALAHLPFEHRSGTDAEPYALKTALGWAVRGPREPSKSRRGSGRPRDVQSCLVRTNANADLCTQVNLLPECASFAAL